MEHMTFISEMVTGCLQHISTTENKRGLRNSIDTYRLQALN